MVARYPHHAVLMSLLKKQQFDACRATTEEMIHELMASPDPSFSPSHSPSETIKQLQERDRELAFLHIIMCMALFSLHQFNEAGEKADIAAFLARKVDDAELLGEALYRAGVCYGAHADYHRATQRLTECIQSLTDQFRGDAYYNRGMAYQSIGAYVDAIKEYESAIAWAAERKPELARRSRMNLAWVLILCREFNRAEAVLQHLASEPGADQDPKLQLQLAHDRVHMAYLSGQSREAVTQAVAVLRQAGKEYPHVRAHIILTLIGLASDQDKPLEAFTLGVLTKRLAAQAHRPDLEEEASRQMRDLECQEGTEVLVESLQRLRQVLRGSLIRRKAARPRNQAGGVG